MDNLLRGVTAEDLYEQFKGRLKKDKPPRIRNLSFIVGRLNRSDTPKIYAFFKKNAPDFLRFHNLSKEIFCEALATSYCITAYASRTIVGYLLLVRNPDLKAYTAAYSCVDKNKRGSAISFYMSLCSFKFAKENMGEKDVLVGVYRANNPRRTLLSTLDIHSLQGSLELWDLYCCTTNAQKFQREREVYLYKTYEEALGLELLEDEIGNYYYKFVL